MNEIINSEVDASASANTLPTNQDNTTANAGEPIAPNLGDLTPEVPPTTATVPDPNATSIEGRIAALEHYFAKLVAATHADLGKFYGGPVNEAKAVEATFAGFSEHIRSLINAGIHKAEDFVGHLFHHTSAPTTDTAASSDAEEASSVSAIDEVVAENKAAAETANAIAAPTTADVATAASV